MNETSEFKALGMTIPTMTVAYGLLLIVWGAVFSIGSESMTSFIPSFIGAPILLMGMLSKKVPQKRKVWMHIAVFLGLAAFLGGFRFFAAMGSEAGLFGKPKAASSQLMLMVTGGIYTLSCIRSFIAARKAD